MNAERSKKLVVLLLSFGLIAGLLAGCAATDVVAKYAVSSYGTMAVAMDASMKDGFQLVKSPVGDEFMLAVDLSGSMDASLSIDAAPFLAAGLRKRKPDPHFVAARWKRRHVCYVDELERPREGTCSLGILAGPYRHRGNAHGCCKRCHQNYRLFHILIS